MLVLTDRHLSFVHKTEAKKNGGPQLFQDRF